MAEQIGSVSIGITGDYTDLHRALDAATVLAQQYGARIAGAFQSAGPALDSLSSQFLKTGTALTAGLTLPIAGLVAAMNSGSEDFRKFELAMRQVTSLMGNVSQNEFKQLSAATLELSTRLGVDAVNAAKGLYEAISAGVPKENAITFLEVASKTAIAGVTNTKVAVDGLTTVLSAFHLETSKAKEVADAMFMAVNLGKITFEQLAASMSKTMPIAAQVGLEFKEILAAAATISRQGVPVSQAMTQIERAIISIIKPGEAMQEVFKKLNVESGQVLLQQKGLQGALEAIRDATGGVASEMAKAFPRIEGFRAIMELTGRNSKVAAEDLKAVTNSTGAMDRAFQEIEKSGSRGFESLKVAMKNLSMQAAEVLAPAIAQIVKNMQPLIEGVMDAVKWFATLDPALQQTAGIMLAMAASAGPLALLAGWFLRIREAAVLLAPSIVTLAGAMNVLAAVPYVALVASLAALAKGIYDLKTARDSMNQSAQQETDSLARLEITLRQAGVNISELSNQYNHGLISHKAYLKGLQELAKEHGDSLPKVEALSKGLKDLTTVPPPLHLAGPIKDIGDAAKESKTSIDEFMDSWNRQFAEAVPTTEDLAQAVRDVARGAYEAADAIGQIPPEFGPVTLAEIAEQARQAGISLEVMVPPALPAKIKDVTEKTQEWGSVTAVTVQKSNESYREVRRAIESISDAMARSIVQWKGWGEAAKNVLEAVAEAILKTVIKRLLEATGVVDKLMEGITAVLSKIGVGAASGAAGAAASSAAAAGTVAAGAGSASTSASGALGSLSNILGIAGLGVSVASGIVQGIQNARMEADIAKIEISTRQVKEQLVGGVQPRLDTYLPKLDHLADIWGTLVTGNQILREIASRVGGVGSSTNTDEILKYLSLLTTPYTPPPNEPIGGATMIADTSSRGRGVAVQPSLPTGGYTLKAGESFTTAPMRSAPLTTAQAIELGAARTGLSNEQFKTLVEQQFKAHPDWYPLGTSPSDIYQPRFAITGTSNDPLDATMQQASREALEKYRAGLITLDQYNSDLTRATNDYQEATRDAALAAIEQRRATDPLVQAMNASRNSQMELTARTMQLLTQFGGHSAVDIGNGSFINVGGSTGPLNAVFSAEQNAAAMQQKAAQLQDADNSLASFRHIANQQVLRAGNRLTQAAGSKLTPEETANVGRLKSLNPQSATWQKQIEDLIVQVGLARFNGQEAQLARDNPLSDFAVDRIINQFNKTADINNDAVLRNAHLYRPENFDRLEAPQTSSAAQLAGFYNQITTPAGPNLLGTFGAHTMGGNSSQGNNLITINALDPSARGVGYALMDVLKQNAIYK